MSPNSVRQQLTGERAELDHGGADVAALRTVSGDCASCSQDKIHEGFQNHSTRRSKTPRGLVLVREEAEKKGIIVELNTVQKQCAGEHTVCWSLDPYIVC